MLNDALRAFLVISVSGSSIAVVLFLLKHVMQNKFSKKWYYYVWLIVIVRLAVPFGLPVSIVSDTAYDILSIFTVNKNTSDNESLLLSDLAKASVNEAALPVETAETESPDNLLLSYNKENIMNTAVSPEVISEKSKSIDFYVLLQYAGIIWIIAGIFLFVTKLIDYSRFTKFVKATSVPVDDDTVLDISYSACMTMGIKKELPVLYNKAIGSPMLMGLLKPVIVLPETQKDNVLHLKYVFMHELTHYKRFDVYYKWLMQIVLCVHWFNPVVYLIGMELNKACELSCDEAVIKKLEPKEQRAYGDTLLHSFETASGYSKSVASLTLAENSKLMKERLRAIMKFQKKSKLAICLSALLTVILCTGAMFAGVEVHSKTLLNYSNAKAENKEDSFRTEESELEKIQSYNKIRVEGISDSENLIIPIDIKELKPNETIIYGPYYLKKYEAWSVDIESFEGGRIFIADMKEGDAFQHSISFGKTPNGSAFIVDESKYYYITIGSDSDVPLKNIKGILTVNFKGEYKSSKAEESLNAAHSEAYSRTIEIDLQEIAPDGHISYGPYDLKAGDIVSSDIKWSNDAGLYFSIGKKFMAFEGFFSRYNKHGEYMDKDITVNEDGLYYVFIGNPSTDEPVVKDVSGVIKIYRNQNNLTYADNKDTIFVDIPKTSGEIYVKNYGSRHLEKGDKVTADLNWKGEGHIMFLYTKEKFDTDDIAALVEKGLLPLGIVDKAFTNGYNNIPSISMGFTYMQDNNALKLNFTTTPNKPIYWTHQVPETGSYYIYVIATGDTGITNIKGGITFSVSTSKNSSTSTSKNLSTKKDLSTLGFPSFMTKDHIPNNLKDWIEECDKVKDIYVTSMNDLWYIYCNSITYSYSLEVDNVTEPHTVILTLSDKDAAGKGEGYALLSAPKYDNIKAIYKDKSVQFTNDDSDTDSVYSSVNSGNQPDNLDDNSVVLDYYNKGSCIADNYVQNINGNKAELKFMNFFGSQVIYELNYTKATTIDFSISADVDGAYKIAFISEGSKIITKASSYNGNSASKPIELPKGKTEVVLVGTNATGNCTIFVKE